MNFYFYYSKIYDNLTVHYWDINEELILLYCHNIICDVPTKSEWTKGGHQPKVIMKGKATSITQSGNTIYIK